MKEQSVLEVREPHGIGETAPCNSCQEGKTAIVIEIGYWNATMTTRLCDGCAAKLLDGLVPWVGLP